MGETELSAAFRKLALDWNSAEDEDAIELRRDTHDVRIRLTAHKAVMTLYVHSSEKKERPQVTVDRIGVLERLGRKMGVDEAPSMNEDFASRFDWQTDAPSHAIGVLFESRGARRALDALAELGALPVKIDGSSMDVRLERVKPAMLAREKMDRLVDALCELEREVGTADASPDRAAKEPTTTVERALDFSPAIAFIGTFLLQIPYVFLGGYMMDRGWSVLVAFAGVLSVVTFVVSLRKLRGQKRAFVRVVARTVGISAIGAQVLFFFAHAINRVQDSAPSTVERVHVVRTRAPHGRSSGDTDFTRQGSDQVYTIEVGFYLSPESISLRIHEGRFGWLWAEVL